MSTLRDLILFNAASATLLAAIAFASRFLRRPSLTHTLWVLVLLRLIAPPLYSLPLPGWPIESVSVTPTDFDLNLPAAMGCNSETESEDVSTIPNTAISAPDFMPATVLPAISWTQLALVLLAIGAAWSLCRQIASAVRFCRSLKSAVRPEPQLDRLIESLSRRMGLRQAPRMILVTDRISPCILAGCPRPTLVIPIDWLMSLSRLQQAAVLVHELAHVRRCDHWVRWLEVLVSALFWWHPIVHLARRQMRDAEECCCDGWVVALLPAARRAYADALVDTLDFLAGARPALPALACGLGQVQQLRRRIYMILKAKPKYRSGRAAAMIALGLAICLPLGVAKSDEPQGNPPPRPRAEAPDQRPRGDGDDRDRARHEEDRMRAKHGREKTDSQNDEVQRLREELRRSEEQIAQAQQRMERVRRRLEELGVETPRRNGPFGPGSEARRFSTPTPTAPPAPPIESMGGRGGAGGEPRRALGGLTPGGGMDPRIDELARAVSELRRAVEEMRRDRERERDRRPPNQPNP